MTLPVPHKTVCLVNGSLRGRKASSYELLEGVRVLLHAAGHESVRVAVRARPSPGYPYSTLEALDAADALVLAFPLYAYCLPAGFMGLLEEYARHAKARPGARAARAYVIVNCGFVEPEINQEAIRVVQNFCARVGLEWRFAVAIGCGPVTLWTKSLDRKLKTALHNIVTDLAGDHCEPKGDVYIRPLIPRVIPDAIRTYLDWRTLKRNQRRHAAAAPPGTGAVARDSS